MGEAERKADHSHVAGDLDDDLRVPGARKTVRVERYTITLSKRQHGYIDFWTPRMPRPARNPVELVRVIWLPQWLDDWIDRPSARALWMISTASGSAPVGLSNLPVTLSRPAKTCQLVTKKSKSGDRHNTACGGTEGQPADGRREEQRLH